MTYQEIPGLAKKASAAATELGGILEVLESLHNQATARIAQYLKIDIHGPDILDVDAIKATLTRPYTLLPINENEAHLIHWRGVRMPIFGWVTKQEPAFTISRVSRGMNMLTPLPEWAREELGWRPPEHSATISTDRTLVELQDGDSGSFKHRYGKHLGASMGDGKWKIKGGDAWIRLIAELIKDGILPYTPHPVQKEDWNSRAQSTVVLRDYQEPMTKQFREKGAVFLNLPPGAGKTIITLWILSHMRGKVLILAPSVILCEQWRERVKEYSPQSDVTILTYASGKKAVKGKWVLVVFDEVQTLPADTFSKLAFLDTKYRIGLSASPWREDGRQYMITALSGFPCSIRWADLIRAGVLKRPRVVIATVPTDAAKTAFTRQLIAKRKGGRALIFCDYLKAGEELADALDVPFVSGSSTKKLEKVQDNPVCVVSRIADRGLDFHDLTLVIEWAFMGKSREQEAQRLGRLLHSQSRGEHYLLFTPKEAERFRPRIFGIESELSGEIDLEFMTVGNIADAREKAIVVHHRPTRHRQRETLVKDTMIGKSTGQKNDEISTVIALRPIDVKMKAAEKAVGRRTAPYIQRVVRYCFAASLSPQEITDGLGITDYFTRSRISSACKALVKAGLMEVSEGGRYRVSADEIARAKALSAQFGR